MSHWITSREFKESCSCRLTFFLVNTSRPGKRSNRFAILRSHQYHFPLYYFKITEVSLIFVPHSTQGLWYLRIRTRRESCLIYWKFQIRYFLWSSIFVPYTKLRNLGDDQHVVGFYTNCNTIVFVCIMWCEHVGTVTLKVKLVEKSCNALKKYIWFLCNFCGFFSIRPQRFLT